MNRIIAALGLVLAFAFCTPAGADHDNTAASDKGTYIQVAKVSGSSTAGTAFFSANIGRMDGLVFNNTATTVFIGTVTASEHGSTHSNILNGTPILSSSSFSLGGLMSGPIYFTCSSTVASCEVRTLEGLNR